VSVRNSLLTILTLGACYGSQLKVEFERRTGGAWPLNVGQVYTTLARLERDGLALRGEPDASGREHFAITPAGRETVERWLRSPAPAAAAQRDEFVMKTVLALTVPGADVDGILAAQEAEASAALRHDPGEQAPQARLVTLAQHEQLAAQLRWIAALRAAERPQPWGLDDELPKRGRPAKAVP
jgi:DNA-binding PadR family transcriptional regulator